MSFNVDILSVRPVIREAANINRDGSGGNSGYMRQQKKEEEKEQKFVSDESIFDKTTKSDVFAQSVEIQIPEEYKFTLKNVVLKLVAKIRIILKNLKS